MMTQDEHDRAYTEGSNAAWRQILALALNALPEGSADRWRLERADAIAALRSICEAYGDNDWPDNLHLGDIIEKHLRRYVEVML